MIEIAEYLPAGVSVEDAVITLASLSAFTATAAVWSALLERNPAGRRARLIATQRSHLKAGLKNAGRTERLQTMSFMRQVVNKFSLLKSVHTAKVEQKLTRAGWRSRDAVIRYLFLKLALPFVFGGGAVALVYGLNALPVAGPAKSLICLLAVLLGAYAPDVFIKNQITKRQEKVRKSLPDALDLMVICAEAGLSLDATLSRVAEELETAAPEICDELSLTSLELGFLPDRRKALRNLAVRTDLRAVRGLVNTLLQSERYGTPLAQSLRIMAKESRDERTMKAEEKAARLPALLTVPMIVFILPPLFVVLIGPAALRTIDALTNL